MTHAPFFQMVQRRHWIKIKHLNTMWRGQFIKDANLKNCFIDPCYAHAANCKVSSSYSAFVKFPHIVKEIKLVERAQHHPSTTLASSPLPKSTWWQASEESQQCSFSFSTNSTCKLTMRNKRMFTSSYVTWERCLCIFTFVGYFATGIKLRNSSSKPYQLGLCTPLPCKRVWEFKRRSDTNRPPVSSLILEFFTWRSKEVRKVGGKCKYTGTTLSKNDSYW